MNIGKILTLHRLPEVCKLSEINIASTSKCYVVNRQVNTLAKNYIVKNFKVNSTLNGVKLISTTAVNNFIKKIKDPVEAHDEMKSMLYVGEFNRHKEKNKKSFLETIKIYQQNAKNRAGHVDFIKAALRHMEEFGVHEDLECYKKIINTLPKGVYIATNRFAIDAMYFPRQQYVTFDLLKQMEVHGVAPDAELGHIIKNIFGAKAHPTKRFATLLYWSLKWKNKSPFILPDQLPSDPLELAKLAIQRITSVDPQSDVWVIQTEEIPNSKDKTWIVSGQSPTQVQLLKNHKKDIPVIVEGGDCIYLKSHSINYFVLKADGEPLPFIYPPDLNDFSHLESKFLNPNYKHKDKGPSVHEQDDGIIYAVCATGTSSKDSLLSWVRSLEKNGNPILADLPVLFRFKKEESLPQTFSEELTTKEN